MEIKDVSLPEGMKRSMSRQAEAERERRARIITADGEYQASKRLAAAANVMARDPAALQLRLLQTVVEVAAERNSTLVMPIPVELLRFFDKFTPSPAGARRSRRRTRRRWPTSATRSTRPSPTRWPRPRATKPISAPAADALEIPEVPAIPELSATEKGDIGTLSEGAPPRRPAGDDRPRRGAAATAPGPRPPTRRASSPEK